MCELLAGHDEAILDPLDTRCLTTRGGTSQAAGGMSLLGVCGRGLGMCRARADASRPRRLQPLLAHYRAKAAEVFAEAPNGGFELRDPAQQDRGTEVDAHGGF